MEAQHLQTTAGLITGGVQTHSVLPATHLSHVVHTRWLELDNQYGLAADGGAMVPILISLLGNVLGLWPSAASGVSNPLQHSLCSPHARRELLPESQPTPVTAFSQ